MPRYSKEHRKIAIESKQPLFTIDLNELHLGGTQTTITGVLGDDKDTYLIGKLRKMLAIAEGKLK